MRLFLILFLTVSCYSISYAQVNTDSLWSVWNDNSRNDTVRLKAIEIMAYDGMIFTNPDSSFKLSQLQFNFAENVGNRKSMATSKNAQGLALQKQGKYRASLPYLYESMAISKEDGDSLGIALCSQNLSSAMIRTGNLDSSIYYNSIVIEIGRKLNDHLLIGAASNTLGAVKMFLGDIGAARTILTDAIDLLKVEIEKESTQKLRRYLANIYNTMGLLENNTANYDLALQYYTQARSIYGELGKDHLAKKVGANIGNINEMKGDFNGAIELFEEGLESARKVGDKEGEAINLSQLAMAHGKLNNTDKATEYYLEALEIHKERGSLSDISRLYAVLGSIAYIKHAYLEAKRYHLLDLKTAKLMDLDAADSDYSGESRAHLNLGGTYMELEMFDSSLYHLNIAKKIKERNSENHLGRAAVYWYLGRLFLKMNNEEAALENYQKVVDISKELNLSNNLRTAEKALFKIFFNNENFDQAEVHLTSLLDSRLSEFDNNLFGLTEYEQSLYFEEANREFDLLYEYAMKRGKYSPGFIEESYNITMNTKGLLLNSTRSMSRVILNSNDTALINQYYEWIVLKNDISQQQSSGNDVSEMEDEANEMEKELVKASHQFYGVRKIKQLSWSDVQSKLGNSETAIEFIRFEIRPVEKENEPTDAIYAALILNKEMDSPQMVKLCMESQLIDVLGHFPGTNKGYIDQIYGRQNNPADSLYKLVWSPIEKYLSNTTKVYLSPAGMLHKISFSALSFNDNNYLCDRYEIESVSSTARISYDNSDRIHKENTIAIFGGIDYNTDATQKEIWSYLEGTLNETNSINELLIKNNRDVKFYSGKEATEEMFKKYTTGKQVLHVATHGFFYVNPKDIKKRTEPADESKDESEDNLLFRGSGKSSLGLNAFVENQNPLMRSGLVLAGANDVWSKSEIKGEDGVLTAQEVSTLDLRENDLVVLSACETGLGDIRGSEGVYGLQRAFKMAGAKYLIMSLWQVPDKETAEFMTMFYTHLVESGNIKESFIQTQKTMRQKYDPYYWAAFVLVE